MIYPMVMMVPMVPPLQTAPPTPAEAGPGPDDRVNGETFEERILNHGIPAGNPARDLLRREFMGELAK